MEVTVLRSTDKPERLVAQAARGDYLDGYVGDTDYDELMEGVKYDEEYLDKESVLHDWSYSLPHENARDIDIEAEMIIRAKTRSFIEKQLSRGHYGPFEHPQITFSVEGVSRVTMAQITRHRHMTFDIQSQRYVDFSDKEAVVPKSLRDPDHFSREDGALELSENDMDSWRYTYKALTKAQFDMYEEMVDAGIPKEDARFLLPVGTPVNMTFSGNARTFLHLLDMRRKADAQWEIRELSDELIDELKSWMPYTFNYYEEHGPNRLGP